VLGFRRSGLRRSLWVIGIAILTAALALWIAAQMHTLHPLLSSARSRFWGYLLWAFLQQFLLQDFFLSRLLRLLPTKTAAIIAAAALFAPAHIPNPLLIATGGLPLWSNAQISRSYKPSHSS